MDLFPENSARHPRLEPLESAISRVLIPAITDRQCGQLDKDIPALPVRLGGLDVANPSSDANLEYTSSVKVDTRVEQSARCKTGCTCTWLLGAPAISLF